MKHVFMLHDIKKHHDFAKKVETVMNGYDYELVYHTSVENAQKYIKEYNEPARFYVVGGDGTLNGLLQVLVHTDHEVVVLPLGTGNDFCRALTNEKDPIVLLKQSLKMKSQKVDTILMNDIHMINSACFGIDEVIASTVHDGKKLPFIPESQSYILSILNNVFHYKHQYVRIRNKDKILYEGNIALCTVNNGIYYGGGFPITPNACITDGYMDICAVDDAPLYQYPYYIAYLVKKKLHKRKRAHYFREKEVIIECGGYCNVDGEQRKADGYHFVMQEKSLNLVIYSNM